MILSYKSFKNWPLHTFSQYKISTGPWFTYSHSSTVSLFNFYLTRYSLINYYNAPRHVIIRWIHLSSPLIYLLHIYIHLRPNIHLISLRWDGTQYHTSMRPEITSISNNAALQIYSCRLVIRVVPLATVSRPQQSRLPCPYRTSS